MADFFDTYISLCTLLLFVLARSSLSDPFFNPFSRNNDLILWQMIV